jgi:glycosidase
MRLLALLLALPACDKDHPADLPDGEGPAACATAFTYTYAGESTLQGVALAGDWNGWDSGDLPMTEVSPGQWSVQVDLPPGAHAYRFVEQIEWTLDTREVGVCDPSAPLIQCDAGYVEQGATDWSQVCAPGVEASCNSLVVVPDCALPTLTLASLDINRGGGALTAALVASPGVGGEALTASATLNGAPLEVTLVEGRIDIALTGLSPGRHSLRVSLVDSAGRAAPEVYIPAWLDAEPETAWRSRPIYFAFVDRLVDGDPTNSSLEGTSFSMGDYAGGDYAGLIELLPYLDDLGVGTLWLSNAQDNAEGAWEGDCEQTYAGYHAYWPDAARDVESHYGSEADLHALIDEAHARGMRVIMDWVANHVHDDHPYAANADWFNPEALCKATVGGTDNWNLIPEDCWFAPYLPDINYSEKAPLVTMVDDALYWVKAYELDGLRVDAVKHMNHAVPWNLEARLRAEVEHQAAGGDEDVWTVGETFDGYERIAAYLHKDDQLQLDGQFDFPMYYAQLGVFATRTSPISDLESAAATAEAVYGDALMSVFLGNHDVVRWTTYAYEGYQTACEADGRTPRYAGLPTERALYERMNLAWTWLYTQPGVPLIYYGDELGMPGFADPDNRKPLWELTGDLSGAALSVDAVADRVSDNAALVLRHVAALGEARAAHPALWRGSRIQWWLSPSDWPVVLATAHLDDESGDAALIILNNGDSDATLDNGLSWAGLPTGGGWTDLLTGERFTASGDRLSLTVYARQSRVLVAD